MRCVVCKEEFEPLLSEKEAEEQLEREFPGYDKGECDIWCDDCYQKAFGQRQ